VQHKLLLQRLKSSTIHFEIFLHRLLWSPFLLHLCSHEHQYCNAYANIRHIFCFKALNKNYKTMCLKNAVFWDVATCRSSVNWRSSETSVYTRSTRPYIPEDGILHSHRRENLKSYNVFEAHIFMGRGFTRVFCGTCWGILRQIKILLVVTLNICHIFLSYEIGWRLRLPE
jgi:hypothetical protein